MGATASALAVPRKFLRLRLWFEKLMDKNSDKGEKNIASIGYRVIARRSARQASV
jgi:hypothetical protein